MYGSSINNGVPQWLYRPYSTGTKGKVTMVALQQWQYISGINQHNVPFFRTRYTMQLLPEDVAKISCRCWSLTLVVAVVLPVAMDATD